MRLTENALCLQTDVHFFPLCVSINWVRGSQICYSQGPDQRLIVIPMEPIFITILIRFDIICRHNNFEYNVLWFPPQ